MSILSLLIPIAIIFLVIAVAFIFWAIRNNQYDDLESPALKVIIDDHQQKKNNNTDKSSDQTSDKILP